MKIEMWLVMMVLISTISAHGRYVSYDALLSGKVDVPSVVTSKFFNSIISKAKSSCRGNRFYTRAAFLKAVKSFPKFADATTLDGKREIAAFFAHATYQTEHFCIIDEIGAETTPYCDRASCTYPCKEEKSYHGRGPMQLKWNCNYGACSEYLELDLLNHPDLLSIDASVSFKSALWYWMNEVHSTINEGFGATIRVINGSECDGESFEAVFSRVNYYHQYCRKFGITPGYNQTC